MQLDCWSRHWREPLPCWSSMTSTRCRTWCSTRPSKRCPWPFLEAKKKSVLSSSLARSSLWFRQKTPRGELRVWCAWTVDPDAGRQLLTSFDSLADEQWLHIHGLSPRPPVGLGTHQQGCIRWRFPRDAGKLRHGGNFLQVECRAEACPFCLSIFRSRELEALARKASTPMNSTSG